MVPRLEHHVDGERAQMFEEPIGRATRDHRLAPGQDGEPSHGMEREGQQIENHQNGGEGFLTMPEIVLEIVSTGLEHVEGLVLDLPS